MPKFTNGTMTHFPKGRKRKDGAERTQKYLRISAGPQRKRYVHDLVMEAKLGRKLEGDETVEHLDGNGLNVDPGNLIVVTRKVNSQLRHQRKLREQRLEREASGQASLEEYEPWKNQF
jgi:hypothetical protein